MLQGSKISFQTANAKNAADVNESIFEVQTQESRVLNRPINHPTLKRLLPSEISGDQASPNKFLAFSVVESATDSSDSPLNSATLLATSST